jgi:hypothetical protein
MQDKQLKSLDKTQLLSIMLSQELEIERLKIEKENFEKQTAMLGVENPGIKKLESDVQMLEVEIQMLKSEKEDLEAQLFEKQFHGSTQTEEIQTMGIKLHTLETEVQMAKDENQMLKDENHMLKGEINKFAVEKANLERQFAENQFAPENTVLAGGANDAMLIQSLADEIQALKADNENLENQLASKQFAVENAENAISADDAILAQSLMDEIQMLKNEIQALNEEKENLEKQLLECPASSDPADPVAEVTLSVSGIIQSAQESAQTYLKNIKRLEEEKISSAQRICDEAQEKADAIIKAAEQRFEEFGEEEKKSLETLQNISDIYMDFIEKAHSSLNSMIHSYKLTQLPKVIK